MSRSGIYRYRTCPVCGERYHVPDGPSWVYRARVTTRTGRRETRFVCSYSCMREAEKIDETRKNKRNG